MIDQLIKHIEDRLLGISQQIGRRLMLESKNVIVKNNHVKTGRLRDSNRYSVTVNKTNITIVVENIAPYAMYVYYGHKIKGSTNKISNNTINKSIIRSSISKSKKNTTKGTPFIELALINIERDINNLLSKII